MASQKHIEILKEGEQAWNKWRSQNSNIRPDLSRINFANNFKTEKGLYGLPEYHYCDFSKVNFRQTSLRNCFFIECNFNNCDIHFADLCDSYFQRCSFKKTGMRVSKIGSASFHSCKFINADLAYCTAEETDFTGSSLIETGLENTSLVKTNFSNTILNRCRLYGISAWDLKLDNCKHENLIITSYDNPMITVDNIEVAQFIYLILSNKKIRDVIDTITSKVVLILGRFTKERKKVLDQIKFVLRERNYIPVLYDFEGPTTRDVAETVSTLAHLARFVIADISSPRSIPHELQKIIPNLPSLPVQPLIVSGQSEYGLFEHFKKFPWVLDSIQYKKSEIKKSITLAIINCEKYLTS